MRFVANDTVLGETLAEARALARTRLLWAGLAGAAFLIGLTGPFDTYSTMQTPMRLAYWALVVMSCYWIGLLISFAAATWFESLNTPPALSVGLGALVASVPITLWLAALHAMLFMDPFWADFIRLLPYVTVNDVINENLPEPGRSYITALVVGDQAQADRLYAQIGMMERTLVSSYAGLAVRRASSTCGVQFS